MTIDSMPLNLQEARSLSRCASRLTAFRCLFQSAHLAYSTAPSTTFPWSVRARMRAAAPLPPRPDALCPVTLLGSPPKPARDIRTHPPPDPAPPGARPAALASAARWPSGSRRRRAGATFRRRASRHSGPHILCRSPGVAGGVYRLRHSAHRGRFAMAQRRQAAPQRTRRAAAQVGHETAAATTTAAAHGITKAQRGRSVPRRR
jgi:hypothetical protein